MTPTVELVAMLDAARRLSEVVIAEYEPWTCEQVVDVEVPVRAWLEVNDPELLAEAEQEGSS